MGEVTEKERGGRVALNYVASGCGVAPTGAVTRGELFSPVLNGWLLAPKNNSKIEGACVEPHHGIEGAYVEPHQKMGDDGRSHRKREGRASCIKLGGARGGVAPTGDARLEELFLPRCKPKIDGRRWEKSQKKRGEGKLH